jgi:predicted ABC-type ATPase
MGCAFLNADVAAARLLATGHAPAGLDVAAGRQMLSEMRRLVEAGESFCLETNLAGRGLVRSISTWRDVSYRIRLAFVALDSADLAVARVAARVAAGGHDVPEPVVRRRWQAGLRALFGIYLGLVDDWAVIDNSDGSGVVVARGRRGQPDQVNDTDRWQLLQELAGGDRRSP